MIEDSAFPKTPRYYRAEEFIKNPFWEKDFLPHLKVLIAALYRDLRTCKIEYIEAVRQKIFLLEELCNLPQTVLKGEALEAELDADVQEEQASPPLDAHDQ